MTYAVGRIGLDSPDAYAAYARTVVDREATDRRERPAITFVGTRHPGDVATAMSADHLIQPLYDALAANPGCSVNLSPPERATKAEMTSLLSKGRTPDLLFTATHGMVFPNGHPRQLTDQGALLCQDFAGTDEAGEVKPDVYVGADDVADLDPAGLIAFMFACYGAGSPRFDDFSTQILQTPREIAPQPFIGGLPQQLLGHPGARPWP